MTTAKEKQTISGTIFSEQSPTKPPVADQPDGNRWIDSINLVSKSGDLPALVDDQPELDDLVTEAIQVKIPALTKELTMEQQSNSPDPVAESIISMVSCQLLVAETLGNLTRC